MMDKDTGNQLDLGKIKKNTYKEQAYELLKNAILYNGLRMGAIYSQDDLCSELGISKTPIREALLELQQEGYVKICRGRGVEIVPVSADDARDILEARLMIECGNARMAAKKLTEEMKREIKSTLAELNDKLSSRDERMLYRVDHQFHREIAMAGGNKWLTEETDKLLDHYLRFEEKSVYNNSIDANIVYREHQAIGDAIIEGNADKAEAMMRRHLNNAYNRTLKKFWDKSSQR